MTTEERETISYKKRKELERKKRKEEKKPKKRNDIMSSHKLKSKLKEDSFYVSFCKIKNKRGEKCGQFWKRMKEEGQVKELYPVVERILLIRPSSIDLIAID